MTASGSTIMLLRLLLLVCLIQHSLGESTCSVDETERDPTLQEMEYDVGDGPQTTLVYVEPDVTTFYQLEEPPSQTRVTPKFNGFQGKFINMSNKPVTLYWYDLWMPSRLFVVLLEGDLVLTL